MEVAYPTGLCIIRKIFMEWKNIMTTPAETLTEIENLSFEEAMKELETLVRKLEEGRVPLKEAITAYERGTSLRKHNEKLLEEARLKIDQIAQDAGGTLSTRPSPLEETL